MQIWTQMLCPECKALKSGHSFPIPLVFIWLCGCFGLACCWNLKAAVLINTVSFLWSYGPRPINMLIHPITQCLPIDKKGTCAQMAELFWIHSIQAFIRHRMLRSPPEKRGKRRRWRKKTKWERVRERADSRNHMTWLKAKVTSLYCSWSAR